VFEYYQKKTGIIKYDHHKFYAVSKEDVEEIEKSGGVIGIILENWWLTGVDPRLPELVGWELSGIDCVMETIYALNEQKGNIGHIKIHDFSETLTEAALTFSIFMANSYSSGLNAFVSLTHTGIMPMRCINISFTRGVVFASI
jgi:hypothetical protein